MNRYTVSLPVYRGWFPPPPPPGAALLEMNCYYANGFPLLPFVYGALCSSPAYLTRHLHLIAIIVASTIVLKRRSALRPGGRIHQCGRRQVRKLLSDRRRRMRDLLNDPVLTKGLERAHGDLSSLRQGVERWELDGFAIQKSEEDDYVKAKGLPWIKTMNAWLSMLFFLTLYVNFYGSTMLVLVMCLAHIIDNMLLQRAAISRDCGRGNKKPEGIAGAGAGAAVGGPVSEPVPEVDVGVPVEGIVTV